MRVVFDVPLEQTSTNSQYVPGSVGVKVPEAEVVMEPVLFTVEPHEDQSGFAHT